MGIGHRGVFLLLRQVSPRALALEQHSILADRAGRLAQNKPPARPKISLSSVRWRLGWRGGPGVRGSSVALRHGLSTALL